MLEIRIKKYKWSLLLLLLSIFTFAACTNNVETDGSESEEINYSYTETEPTETEKAAPAEVEKDRPQFGAHGLPLIYLTEEARDIVLEDFDYLVELLLENAPTQVVVNRRFGVPFEDVLAHMRSNIEQMEPVESLHFIMMGDEDLHRELPTDAREIAAEYLSSVLLWLTIELEFLGHLSPQTLEGYVEMLEIHLAMLHQMEVVDDRIMINGEDQGSASSLPWLQRRADAFSAEASLWFYGITLDDINLYRDMEDFGFREEGNVTTDILEEGHIAYLHINSFMNNRAFDSEILFPFYEEVQDFEHLIIDLRGNGGGTLAYLNYIIPMLIDEPVEASYHEFLMAGALVYRELDEDEMDRDGDETAEVALVTDFMEDHDFPYFNRADLAILEYVVTWSLTFEPREDHIPFAGDIWILVDDGSASLSEMMAMIAIDSGFATVVGEPTAGVTPAMHTYISLPNTGIVYRMDLGYIIDAQGRSLEEHGVTPDIPNARGRDALDTVLDLISEQ